MAEPHKPLFDRTFLHGEYAGEYERFKDSEEETRLIDRLRAWHERQVRGEAEIEAAFIGRFFEETWGYRPAGHGPDWTLQQQFAVPGAGAGGQIGSADLALGLFGADGTATPQVLCEFKGVGQDLDKPQARKGNTRSPARQALDYLNFARRGLFENAAVLPRFAIVTDMNVFRLYWYDRAPQSWMEFRIAAPQQAGLFEEGRSLLGESEADRFDRFLFARLFKPDMLLSEYGRPPLERLIESEGIRQKRLENAFYKEYRNYRLRLYDQIKLQPLDGASDREKLRLAQKLLDRLVFVMFTEDMGGRIAFPPHLLRDMLSRESLDRFFEPEDTRIWQNLRRLFQRMDEGGVIGDDRIHRFNGGLFEADPLLDRLELPNHLFCKRGQGRNPATVEADKDTLLYLAATYNFATGGDSHNSLGLYTLGHIFEQSLIDLEILEAEAEARLSLSVITKRKRDGVYYTPEPIVLRIIEETAGPLIAAWRAEAGWPEGGEPSLNAANAYWDRLKSIRIVDPACGSGAFLISAYGWLFAEMRRTLDKRRDLGSRETIDDAELTRHILATNLYGVDINPLSVEITQLSLWLHSARAKEPLSKFTHTIRCGNSLVDNRIYDRGPLQPPTVERLAPFEWETAFPEVFPDGGDRGFDVVIGNPPYVKLQHFRRVYEESARYLREGADRDGNPFYASTQTGNYDLYLPFIEKGLALLRPGGRMGYIAPNLWPTLEYGEALRRLIVGGQHLARWIDFRSHQIFEEATIYSAIQIFTASPNDRVEVAFARDGDLGKVDWTAPDAAIGYDEFDAGGGAWLLAPAAIRALMLRLGETCRRLDDPHVTAGIIVGIHTSADHIYHLERRANGRYLRPARRSGAREQPAIELDIEDAIMKPLISGAEAKRLLSPQTGTYLLFPYCVDEAGARLWTPDEMAERFPKAWAWLRDNEAELRARDSGKNDDDRTWFGYIYPKNLDKQEVPKLIVPRLVPSLRLAIDGEGQVYCDNVDVGGVVPAPGFDLHYLAGILASPLSDLLFRWLSKPFRGDYLSANKQFIAPLPIPHASDADTAETGEIARRLQAGYTERARLRRGLSERLSTLARRRRGEEWLLPDVQSKAQIEAEIRNLPGPVARREYADKTQPVQIEAALSRVEAMIRIDSAFEARFADGELMLLIDGAPAARGIYADAEQGAFWLAQWQAIALAFEPNGRGNAKRLIDALRTVADEAPPAVRGQIVERQQALSALAVELDALEARLHAITCRLFDLSPAERRLAETR